MPKTLTITLDKEYTLSYGTGAYRRFEAACDGKPIFAVLTSVLGVTQIVNLVWAGLYKHHPQVSITDLEDAIDAFTDSGGSILDIVSRIDDAVSESGWFDRPTKGTPTSETPGSESSPSSPAS